MRIGAFQVKEPLPDLREPHALVVDKEPHLRQAVQQLERYYEARGNKVEEESPKLSPEVEKFLREATRRFG